MNGKTVNYKESRKKQVTWGFVWFLIVVLSGIALYPVNTPKKVIVFALFSITTTIFVLWVMRKAAKEVICPYCNTDLYELIQTIKQAKAELNFCPICGNELMISNKQT